MSSIIAPELPNPVGVESIDFDDPENEFPVRNARIHSSQSETGRNDYIMRFSFPDSARMRVVSAVKEGKIEVTLHLQNDEEYQAKILIPGIDDALSTNSAEAYVEFYG